MCYLKLDSKMTLFADDTTISTCGKKYEDIVTTIEKDLTIICDWLKHNRLIINVTKTKAMYFSRHLLRKRKTHKEAIKNLKISCNDSCIEFTDEIKVLGFFIDKDLKFGAQVDNICRKANSKTFLLRKSLYLFSDNFKPILFKIFILPHFDYCSTLVMHLSNAYYKERLNRCYIKSIKRLLKLSHFSISSDLNSQYTILQNYNILPLFYRQFYRYCTFLFNVLKNKNTILCTYFVKNNNQTRSDFVLPKFNTVFKKYSFSVISCNLLNGFISNCFNDNLSIFSFKNFLNADIARRYDASVRFWS